MKLWKGMMLIAPFTLALSTTPAPARAQRGQGPCREDIQKFCAGVQPSGGGLRDCLRQHETELSSACQQRVQQMKTRMAAWRQACESDVQQFCSSVAPGRGGIVACLRQHQDDLSQACKDQLASAGAQRGQGPCREDIQKFCAGAQPGGGRFRDCLQQHAAELSPACQQHVQQMKTRMAAWRQACESDVQKLCSGVAPGRGGIVACLHQHENELSQACKDQLAQGRGPRGPAPAPAP